MFILPPSAKHLEGFLTSLKPLENKFFFWYSVCSLALLFWLVNSKFFEQFASLGYFISILLLVGLFVFGKTVSGATSWYNIGGISFQPSELAKVTTALIIASLLSKFQSDIKTPRTLFKIGAYVLLPFLLIVLQPDPWISFGVSVLSFFPCLEKDLIIPI